MSSSLSSLKKSPHFKGGVSSQLEISYASLEIFLEISKSYMKILKSRKKSWSEIWKSAPISVYFRIIPYNSVSVAEISYTFLADANPSFQRVFVELGWLSSKEGGVFFMRLEISYFIYIHHTQHEWVCKLYAIATYFEKSRNEHVLM